MASFTEIARKKVLGIPVLYLAAAAVIVLAIVAWRIKPSPEPDTEPVDAAGPEDLMDPDLSGLATNGTVTVVQQDAKPADVDTEPKTNDDWVREGAEWLTAERNIPGTTAFAALSKYVNGQDTSFDEQELVNSVIKEKGQPPSAPAEGGTGGTKPPTSQGTPPLTHVIKGTTDNTYPALASLYYGSSAGDRIDLLQAANASTLGRSGPWGVGTKVNIPAYHPPVYYLVTIAGQTAAQVASKNGITLTQLAYLNNPKNEAYAPTYPFKKGQRVRVK